MDVFFGDPCGAVDLGMGQKETTGGPQVLVYFSFYQ